MLTLDKIYHAAVVLKDVVNVGGYARENDVCTFAVTDFAEVL